MCLHMGLYTIFQCLAVLGGLTVYPRDTQVIAGDTAKLTCSTNNPSMAIYWNYSPVGVDPSSPDSRPTYVYRYGDVIKRFRARFEVERNESAGATNLVIGQVNASDAGTYICQDNDGFGETGRAQLIVLGMQDIVWRYTISFRAPQKCILKTIHLRKVFQFFSFFNKKNSF